MSYIEEEVDLEELLKPEPSVETRQYAVMRFYGKVFHVFDDDDPDEVLLRSVWSRKHPNIWSANPELAQELSDRYERLFRNS